MYIEVRKVKTVIQFGIRHSKKVNGKTKKVISKHLFSIPLSVFEDRDEEDIGNVLSPYSPILFEKYTSIPEDLRRELGIKDDMKELNKLLNNLISRVKEILSKVDV